MVRVLIWMSAKALDLTQTIREEGDFNLTAVYEFTKNKKPGMACLCDFYRLVKHKSIRKKRLGDVN